MRLEDNPFYGGRGNFIFLYFFNDKTSSQISATAETDYWNFSASQTQSKAAADLRYGQLYNVAFI